MTKAANLSALGTNTSSSGVLEILSGGTGQTTANSSFNALAPSQTSNTGKYLTTDGTDTSWAAVTQTTFSAGTTGFTPNTATSGTVTLAGTLNVANGGTGTTTAQAAINTFAGATTSGQYLRGNGTNVVMSTIQAGDVPTLNQNTTGMANFSGVLATSQATTSGTEKDFTGIPSSANRITVILNGVSTNGTSLLILRLGTSGGIVSSGYTCRSGYSFGAGVVSNTTGATVSDNTQTADLTIGQFNICRLSGNEWVITGNFAQTNQPKMSTTNTTINLGGTLDRIRLTSVSGNTFDAGSINILYE